MVSGLTFDVVLAASLIILAVWEAVVAWQLRSRKRALVVVLSLAMAALLLYLRGPELITPIG